MRKTLNFKRKTCTSVVVVKKQHKNGYTKVVLDIKFSISSVPLKQGSPTLLVKDIKVKPSRRVNKNSIERKKL